MVARRCNKNKEDDDVEEEKKKKQTIGDISKNRFFCFEISIYYIHFHIFIYI